MTNNGAKNSNAERPRDESLCRSVLYGALSLGLHPPRAEHLDLLRSEDARLALSSATALLGSAIAPEGAASPVASPDVPEVNLVSCAQDWIGTWESLTLDCWLSAYGKLFGHTARGPVCPYETEYGQDGLFEQPRQLAKIMGYYQAFGLTTRAEERERADHASCELEFMDFLCRKEAFALESGDEETLRETRKAQRLFLRDHLGRFGRAFARLLAEQSPGGFYGELGRLFFDFLTFECLRLDIRPGAPLLSLRSAEEANVPMACGSQEELVQLQVPR